MRVASLLEALAVLFLWSAGAQSLPTQQIPFQKLSHGFNRTISTDLFYELEELSRIVDISYCVGTTGIQKPFLCASRCQDFSDFELVRVSVAHRLSSIAQTSLTHSSSRPGILVLFWPTHAATLSSPTLPLTHGSSLPSVAPTPSPTPSSTSLPSPKNTFPILATTMQPLVALFPRFFTPSAMLSVPSTPPWPNATIAPFTPAS